MSIVRQRHNATDLEQTPQRTHSEDQDEINHEQDGQKERIEAEQTVSGEPSRTAIGNIYENKLGRRAVAQGWVNRMLHPIANEDSEAIEIDIEDLTLEERARRAREKRISIGEQIWFVLFGLRQNVLLPFISIGFALQYTKQYPIGVFTTNFLAIVPSAKFAKR